MWVRDNYVRKQFINLIKNMNESKSGAHQLWISALQRLSENWTVKDLSPEWTRLHFLKLSTIVSQRSNRRRQTNATLANLHLFRSERLFEKAFRGKVTKMEPMWVWILSRKWLEEPSKNSHWRKIAWMQPVRLCLDIKRQFEAEFENSLSRKNA